MTNRLLMAVVLLTAFVVNGWACTNFIVGKKASADGSVIVSYSADSYGMFGWLYHYPAATHPEGTMRDIRDWDTGKYLGQIKEAKQTYNEVLPHEGFQRERAVRGFCLQPVLGDEPFLGGVDGMADGQRVFREVDR